MEYAKLQLMHTRAAIWRLAGATARGAAVSVLAYSADQEHGGCIPDARTWDDATWRAAIGLPLTDVELAVASRLCHWDEDGGLRCILYDHVGGAALDVRRAQGPHGAKGAAYGKLGGRPPRNNPLNGKGVSKGVSEGVSGAKSAAEKPPQTPMPNPPSPVQSSPDQSSQQQRGPAAALAAAGDVAPGDDVFDVADPLLVMVDEQGGFLVDHGNGEVLSEAWAKVLVQLNGEPMTPEQVAEVFANAKRLTTHEVRYPSGFAKALEALRKERRAEQTKHDHDEAQRAQEQRREAERAQLDADRRRSAYQVERLDAWLLTEAGGPTKAVIAMDPIAKRWLDGAHKHARTGGGANLALRELVRLHPELEPFWHLDAPAPQGSAP